MEYWVRSLVVLGVLPFVICSTMLIMGVATFPLFGSVQVMISVYAIVIGSFMAGAHWGQHLDFRGKWSVNLPIMSNVVAVTLWLSYLLASFKAFMLICAGVFSFLLWVDQQLYQIGFIRSDYFRLRVGVTLLVLVSLITMVVMI